MRAAREISDIWFMLKSRWGRQRLRTWKFWRHEKRYILRDTLSFLLDLYYRLISCPFFGHGLLTYVAVQDRVYCYNCCRIVKGPLVGPVTKLARRKFSENKP